MYFSQGLDVVQTKRHKETRQSISHNLWLKHFYSLKAIDIFCVFSQFIVKTPLASIYSERLHANRNR